MTGNCEVPNNDRAQIMKILRSFPVLLFVLSSAACTLNSVRPLPTGGVASAHRAVIVYGVEVADRWPYAAFAVEVAEYDVAQQNITGNCFRFNRAQARVPPVPGPVSYFAFDVPAGHYVYSPFNRARLAGDSMAFEAPAGRSVYLGSFRLEPGQLVTLTRDPVAAGSALHAALPRLEGPPALAALTPAGRARPFLCAP